MINWKAAAMLGACVLGTSLLHWAISYYQRPTAESISAAPAVKQSDGSVVLRRDPLPAGQASKPPHQIPVGYKPERQVSAKIQPRQPDCPPVTVDMTIARDDEGGRRVIVSSPDGEVIDGLDIPLERGLVMPEQKKWAVGLAVNPADKRLGVWAARDLGRLRLGADVRQATHGGVEAWVSAGWTF